MSSSNQSSGGAGGASPTWDTIKTYFRPTDITHMKSVTKGSIDLSNCASVAAHAQDIYNMVCTDPNNPDCQGSMPPDQNWSEEWQQNFLAWMKAGSPCS
jgi:hypothetical protein